MSRSRSTDHAIRRSGVFSNPSGPCHGIRRGVTLRAPRRTWRTEAPFSRSAAHAELGAVDHLRGDHPVAARARAGPAFAEGRGDMTGELLGAVEVHVDDAIVELRGGSGRHGDLHAAGRALRGVALEPVGAGPLVAALELH